MEGDIIALQSDCVSSAWVEQEEAFDVLNAFSALGVGTVSVPASAMEPIPHHPCGHLYITLRNISGFSVQ